MTKYDISAVKANCVKHNKRNHEDEVLITGSKAKQFLRSYSCEREKDLGVIGIPVADFDGKSGEREMLLAENSHTLVIGSTGTGKTQCHILPFIEKLSNDGGKASFIAVDVKGELSRKTVNSLKRNGYKVMVFNFSDPLRSSYYNPLAIIYEKYMEARKLENELNSSLEEKVTKAEKKKLLLLKSQVNMLDDFCFTEINKIGETLIPIESAKESSWDYGSRELTKGVIHGMLETAKKNPSEMPLSKFTLANIYNILACRGDDCRTLRDWYEEMPNDCTARLLMSQYVNIAAKQTRDSFIVNTVSKLQRYYGLAFQILTSGNDINILDVVEKTDTEKQAIFIVIDDSKSETYNLCQIFLSQLLKNLREKAKSNPTNSLTNPFYFIMDEFCNMPPFADIEKWITSLRNYNIWLTMVVQSYEQLSESYSAGKAAIVKGNCDIRLFFGSRDVATLELVSKEAGKTCQAMVSENMANNGEVSVHVVSADVPLLRVSDLKKLKQGEMVLFYRGKVFLLKTLPYYARHNDDDDFYISDQVLNPYYDSSKYFYSIESKQKPPKYSSFF